MNKLFPFAFTLLLLTIIPHAHGQYFGVTESSGSKWKAGIQFGYSQLQGDVTVDEFGFHGGAFLQKALGRAMDFRIQFKGGQTQGLNLESSNGFLFNSAWNGWQDSVHFYDSTQSIYHNYQLQFFDLSFLLKINLNRLFSSDGGDKWDLYAIGGVGAQFYQTHINMFKEADRTIYDFSTISSSGSVETLSQLRELMDETYETPAHVDPLNSNRWRNFTINTIFSVGAGFSIAVSERMALGIEGLYTFAGDDLLDGQQWTASNELSTDRDKLLHGSLQFLFFY